MSAKRKTPAASTIGQRLRAAREAKGMTHEDLAQAAGLSLDAVIKLQGDHREPKAETIIALCRALGLSADELLGLD